MPVLQRGIQFMNQKMNISDEEIYSIEEIKLKGEFVNQEDVLEELGINTDEIYNRL